MTADPKELLLITGATGLVGSHVLARAADLGIPTRVFVRPSSDVSFCEQHKAEIVLGDLSNRNSLTEAVSGVTHIVHCAAKVGDWGSVEPYRQINVDGLKSLIFAAQSSGSLHRFIHISSLGVYPARDHHGTDESTPVSINGIDGYTLTKVEAEQIIQQSIQVDRFPATILRPGFIYGPRDRTVLPRILERLKKRKFAFLGSGEQLMNNTFVGNLIQAIFLTLDKQNSLGHCYNITDDRLVSKLEFIKTIAELSGYSIPKKHVPLPLARFLAKVMEGSWKLLGKTEAPILSSARIKFLGLNLDYSIEKAKRELGYAPTYDFSEGMKLTINWFQEHGDL